MATIELMPSAPARTPAIARAERAALCDLFDTVGPDAPTLCAGWTTRDLAAHLALRERRLDAVAGHFVRPLAGHHAKVTRAYTALEWPDLVGLVRAGPPRRPPFGLPGLDAALSALEYFVHHEDVRRARPGWAPRDLPLVVQDDLWRRLRLTGRLLFLRAGVGVVLRRPDGTVLRARGGSAYVTLAGEPAELVLYGFGRGDHTRTEVLGDDAAIERFGRAPLTV